MARVIKVGFMAMILFIGNYQVGAAVSTNTQYDRGDMVEMSDMEVFLHSAVVVYVNYTNVERQEGILSAPITLLKLKDYGVIEYFTEYLHRQRFYLYNESIKIPGSSQLKYNYRENRSSQIQILKNKKVHLKC
jgi:hypothetical protein